MAGRKTDLTLNGHFCKGASACRPTILSSTGITCSIFLVNVGNICAHGRLCMQSEPVKRSSLCPLTSLDRPRRHQHHSHPLLFLSP